MIVCKSSRLGACQFEQFPSASVHASRSSFSWFSIFILAINLQNWLFSSRGFSPLKLSHLPFEMWKFVVEGNYRLMYFRMFSDFVDGCDGLKQVIYLLILLNFVLCQRRSFCYFFVWLYPIFHIICPWQQFLLLVRAVLSLFDYVFQLSLRPAAGNTPSSSFKDVSMGPDTADRDFRVCWQS